MTSVEDQVRAATRAVRVFSHGSFRPLPYPVPGNWYQYAAGSLLDQVAW
jgi:hypothetical protein